MTIDWRAVSDRVRIVTGVPDRNDLRDAARQLSVSEAQLRDAVTGRFRLGWQKVLSAVVRQHGIDPSWILTGRYDGTTHTASLEGDRVEVELLMKRLVAEAISAPERRASAR
jgi:hypothetical protein